MTTRRQHLCSKKEIAMNQVHSAINSYAFKVVGIGLTLLTLASTQVRGESADVIYEWNRLVQNASPNWRAYAIMHVAMFDAANSIADAYTPFRIQVQASRGASQQVAAAQAAHDVLTALFPAQQQAFSAALERSQVGIPRGLAEQGKLVGSRVAQDVLKWRQEDGWPATITPDENYPLPPFPGLYQRTPTVNSAPTFTFYRNATPFAILSSTQFLPPSPPAITSARYAEDFNETKMLGELNSGIRTPAQTLLAQIVHGVNTTTVSTRVWNNVTGDVARSRALDLVDAARLFALLNVSFNDAIQTSFTSKFVYNMWRPVTAIRLADQDRNDATVADPNWLPLLPTPPYPSYAGNMACLSFASARTLSLALGRDDIPLSVTWERTMGLANETLQFSGFLHLAEQMAISRVYGGIHFKFDTDASKQVCGKVGEYVYSNFMRPK
jgi:PAP2 superfamily